MEKELARPFQLAKTCHLVEAPCKCTAQKDQRVSNKNRIAQNLEHCSFPSLPFGYFAATWGACAFPCAFPCDLFEVLDVFFG